jgi:hypothetical protein
VEKQNFVIVTVLSKTVAKTDLVEERIQEILEMDHQGMTIAEEEEIDMTQEETMIVGEEVIMIPVVVDVSVVEIVTILEIQDVMITIVEIDSAVAEEMDRHHDTMTAEAEIGTIPEIQDHHMTPIVVVDVSVVGEEIGMTPVTPGAMITIVEIVVMVEVILGIHHRVTMIEIAVTIGMVVVVMPGQHICALVKKVVVMTTGMIVTIVIATTIITSRKYKQRKKCYVRWQRKNCKITSRNI